MINQQIYIVNGRPHVRVIQQPVYGNNPYQQRNVYINNPPPPQQYMQQRQQHIDAIDGIPITEQYEPERGDPVVVEEAIYKAEVVLRGNKDKEVINEEEAIITSEGYASEDGKMWKPLPKIMMTVFKLGRLAIQTVTKVKAKFDTSLPNHKIMKMTSNNAEFYLGFKDTVFDEWFLRLVWAKLMLERRECQNFGQWERQIRGKIFKKSQIMGEWELRTVMITPMYGLQSFKDNSNSASLQIKHTKQIWTRFEEIKGGYFLVIKLWYGIIKTEFAVPTAHCLGWLYHFLTLLSAV